MDPTPPPWICKFFFFFFLLLFFNFNFSKVQVRGGEGSGLKKNLFLQGGPGAREGAAGQNLTFPSRPSGGEGSN